MEIVNFKRQSTNEIIANVADRILRIEDGQIIQDTVQKIRN